MLLCNFCYPLRHVLILSNDENVKNQHGRKIINYCCSVWVPIGIPYANSDISRGFYYSRGQCTIQLLLLIFFFSPNSHNLFVQQYLRVLRPFLIVIQRNITHSFNFNYYIILYVFRQYYLLYFYLSLAVRKKTFKIILVKHSVLEIG